MPVRVFAMLLPALALSAQPTPGLLSRVAEEAEAFQQNIRDTIGLETLEQRTLLAPTRFRPRAGADAVRAAGPRLAVREIVSEYAVGPLRRLDAPTLVELRQILSVDGRTVRSAEAARHALSLGLRSGDDRLRKRMLEDFAKNGLVDVATEYGLILLAFTKREQRRMAVTPAGEAMMGADHAFVFAWAQMSSESGELEFRGRQVSRRALQGNLWVRDDGLPLRVQAWVEYMDDKGSVRDEATVEYLMSPHGFLVPASVVHRHIMNGRLVTENLYRYESFKRFSAEAEIKFTELPEK